MAKFKDGLDRSWTITIDVLAIQHVRTESKAQFEEVIDLADPEGQSFDRLAANPILLVGVLHLLLEEQIQEQELDEKKFVKGLVGDALTRATKALLQAITDFFPEHGRAVLAALAAKQERLREVAYGRTMEVLQDPEIDKLAEGKLLSQMDEKLEEALTQLKSATGSPASSIAGTSADSPGENSNSAPSAEPNCSA